METPSNKTNISVIIEENKNLIFKIVNAYCSDKNEQEDVIQEIIFHLLNSYDSFDHSVKVTTWMYRVAFNVTISHCRKLKTRQKHLQSMPARLVVIAEEETDHNDERINQLRTFIKAFDPLNRAIVIMYLDGNSHKEISEAMGISVSNVGTKINRIKKHLKKKFKQ